MQKLMWGGAALAVFIIAIIVTVPAKHVLYRLDLPLNLTNVNGTIWNGKASTLQLQQYTINNVAWRINAWSLLTGQLTVSLNAGIARDRSSIYAKGNAGVNLFNQHLIADKLTLRFPAEKLLENVNLPVKVLAKGVVETTLDSAELKFTQTSVGCAVLNGAGQWRQAAVLTPSGEVDLGLFEGVLGCNESQLTLTVAEPNGLGLSFIAQGQNPQNLTVNGKFKLPPELPNEMQQVARFFGEPDNTGYVAFNW